MPAMIRSQHDGIGHFCLVERGKKPSERRVERQHLRAHLRTFGPEAMPDIVGRRKADRQHVRSRAAPELHLVKGRQRNIESHLVKGRRCAPAALIARLAQLQGSDVHLGRNCHVA